ncbi:MAG: SPOR domain-containing protein, partial [Magnetococcales bacterium]|nr:SPOR domain-containing protein [Magnetococcales bacterium]
MVPGIAATLFSIFVLLVPWLAMGAIGEQGAFITNAYFSDKLVEVGEVLKPSSVVSVLPANMSGVNGYFIMDVVFIETGTHQLQIDILDRNSKKIADMAYDPVQVRDKDHVYTVVGSVAGEFPSGWLFFKVFDQINSRERQHLSTFYIMTRDPADSDQPVQPKSKKGEHPKKAAAQLDKPALGDFKFNPNPPPEGDAARSRETSYSIYLGSYGNSNNAQHVTARVNALGIPSFYKTILVNGQQYYRVNAGSFSDAAEAELAVRLIEEKTGIKGSVHDLAVEMSDARHTAAGQKMVAKPGATAPSASAPSVSAPSASAPSVSAPSVSAPPADANLIYAGSFSERKPARETYEKLEKLHLPVFHQQTKVGQQPFIRLFVGPFASRDKLTAALRLMQDKLDIKGIPIAEGQASQVISDSKKSPNLMSKPERLAAEDARAPAHKPESRPAEDARAPAHKPESRPAEDAR